ncbi:MAG TPA: FliA/WhiG family RNA polymerase sigma factor, partial [Candidatus Avimonas sp.]|nr:FliA/WhiG family RNA polymerase sigma factor [Candidatus Avimonas sp.]
NMNTAYALNITDDIWEQYKATRSLELRNKILMNYLGIVKCIAIKMNSVYKSKADMEDIINEGVLVLMDCIEKYDPDRGAKFETYASFRIRGAIIDFIRNQDWVPRSLRKKVKTVEDAYYKLQSESGNNVSDEEVAAHLNISIDELNKTIGEANSFFLLSYEEMLLDNSAFNNFLVEDSTEWQIHEEELKSVIAQSIDELNENERAVISLYYYEELKLKDIARVLGVTQSRVSQIHAKALMKMKNKLKKYLEE